MNDQKIIELIKSQRQDNVFPELYKYFPVVKKLVLANGGNKEDAEDLYQEALIVFYKKARTPDFRLTSSINTYLYSICRYMWKDRLKKQNKTAFVEIQENIVDEREMIEEVEKEKQFLLAEKAVSELGERCKKLLIQFYVHAKKLKDIAKSMGYNSEKTAKNQKYKCLESAKNKLKTLHSN